MDSPGVVLPCRKGCKGRSHGKFSSRHVLRDDRLACWAPICVSNSGGGVCWMIMGMSVRMPVAVPENIDCTLNISSGHVRLAARTSHHSFLIIEEED